MSSQSAESILQVTTRYRGVQGLYFLNKRGDLGYINADSSRAVRETFPQVKDRALLEKYPDFMDQIEGLLRQMADIPGAYLERGKSGEIELGYVVPPVERETWASSSLVLHRPVLDELRRDQNMALATGAAGNAAGIMDGLYLSMSGVNKGFADLLNHRNAFGVCPYFPVLFKLPGHSLLSTTPQQKAPLRVLNLKWADDDGGGSAERYARFPAVFSILRANVIKRSAWVGDGSGPFEAAS